MFLYFRWISNLWNLKKKFSSWWALKVSIVISSTVILVYKLKWTAQTIIDSSCAFCIFQFILFILNIYSATSRMQQLYMAWWPRSKHKVQKWQGFVVVWQWYFNRMVQIWWWCWNSVVYYLCSEKIWLKQFKMSYSCCFMVEWNSSIYEWWKSHTHGVLQLGRQLSLWLQKYWSDQLWILLYLQTWPNKWLPPSLLWNWRVNSKLK